MIYVAGSNLFSQWFIEDPIINQFRSINSKFVDLNNVKIIDINWSYNILQIENKLYISGAWNDKKQLHEVPLPNEYNVDVSDLNVAGNDNNIILANKNTLWLLDLSMKKEIKKYKLNIEEPLSDTTKKRKIPCIVKKIVVVNDSCIFLNMAGSIYYGILPIYVDTNHCNGNILDIACGYEHFMLLTDIGRVYTWGNGRRLQLGHGDVSNIEIPTEVEALAGIKITKICAGGWHCLALSEFGDLYAWGWNESGQLGIKETNDLNREPLKSYAVPTLVDLYDNDELVEKNIIDIACGSKHSAILLEDNSVWTTGFNKYGQLGFSEVKYESINSFKKSLVVDRQSVLMCGPWTTVICSGEHCAK